ncbi:MAG: cation-translocating P-type ATPase [Burkholderiales bacterium]|nr:cation-translocating P-type ATPase [Burkholderiales bacterium]
MAISAPSESAPVPPPSAVRVTATERSVADSRASSSGDFRTSRVEECVLDVFDMHCAACASLIESALSAEPGVQNARVYYATQRARVRFEPSRVDAERLLHRIEALGYSADAEATEGRSDLVRRQRRRKIWGFGLATFCAMQIMMLTLPRYLAGAEIEPELAPLLDWSAFALALPVLYWCARPFYRGALRELRLRRPGMDVAITIGIVTAFAGSMWHLLAGTGTLYFDSVAMFVALLLGVRWLEWEQRERNQAVIRTTTGSNAETTEAIRLTQLDGREVMTPVAVGEIAVGDRLRVRTGEAIAVDGRLESAIALCDEALLTGESSGVRHEVGDALAAGAINLGEAFTLRVTATVDASTERRLMLLADQASKPEANTLSDVIARYFMPALILVAGATFVALLPSGLNVAMERAVAVLIISCPCALALAAPAAQARAFSGLLARGIVLRRAHALERLAAADAFLLDKTGTLSQPETARVHSLRAGWDERRALSVIGALERAGNHPLAVALRSFADDVTAHDVAWEPSRGVSGVVDGDAYRFGRADYVFSGAQLAALDSAAGSQLWLTDTAGPVAALDVSERLCEDAPELITALKARGSVEILSGDRQERATAVASVLGIALAHGAQTPAGKSARIQQLQREGRTTVMIGDGVNDSVGFAGADVAIAVHSATDAARAAADLICTRPALTHIADALRFSRQTAAIVHSNFAWAIGYNLLAIPFAVSGAVNPLVASVGMAASSAIVMFNVLRLRVTPPDGAGS